MNLCRAQRNLGHDSTLMLFAARGTEFEVDGVPILTVRARPFVHGVNQNFDPVPRELGRFACALASYDVIHTHNLACDAYGLRSEEHTSELQSRPHLVCRLLLEKKNKRYDSVSS